MSFHKVKDFASALVYVVISLSSLRKRATCKTDILVYMSSYLQPFPKHWGAIAPSLKSAKRFDKSRPFKLLSRQFFSYMCMLERKLCKLLGKYVLEREGIITFWKDCACTILGGPKKYNLDMRLVKLHWVIAQNEYQSRGRDAKYTFLLQVKLRLGWLAFSMILRVLRMEYSQTISLHLPWSSGDKLHTSRTSKMDHSVNTPKNLSN